ncbi:MAG: aminotransferase class I/II-fold pyridoxal phosphate-dependent enzyme [Trueperaceae bacterium]|nr:aminotransferase class I/II-fold pyridoxal phosphate-dependent enzyme [Trueperaceae bacterium]
MNNVERYMQLQKLGLKLNMQRGLPSPANLDLVNPIFEQIDADDTLLDDGTDLRNYGGGVFGLAEARAYFASVLEVEPAQVLVGNNASLELQGHALTWALLKGVKDKPWLGQNPKIIVTIPGYDRHFHLLQTLGYDLQTVEMTPDGPDMGAVEKLASADESIKGILFVPTYSNPTGDTLSESNAQRLASMKAAAHDFTIFADDAYRVHHLFEPHHKPANILKACQTAGNPDRAFVFASTSKITLAGAGLGYLASSEANLKRFGQFLGAQTIGPNKLEQLRHVRFLKSYSGGLEGLMKDHAAIIAPKFEAVLETLEKELSGTGLATWSNPKGGYFISLDTQKPIADKVVQLAKEAGVSLTPAGATYPDGNDPHNSNIRLAPTYPPVSEVKQAMEIVALCIKLASEDSN